MFFDILFFLLLIAKNSALDDDFYFNFTIFNDNGTFSSSQESEKINSEEDSDIPDKIYGGSEATLGQFPFMAIVHRLAGNGQYFVCGGSIISKRWVLTAGHCVARHPRKFFVVFGIVDKSNLGYDYLSGEDGMSMIATQGALHAGYGLGKHDIGLLYMPEDIPFSDTVQPIRLAGRSYRDESFSANLGHIYGWGKDGNADGSVKRLNFGRVAVISNSVCRGSWGVDGGHVCTESTIGQDVCQGDSGGPLVIHEEDADPLQIGIVSYGDGGCPSNRPAVFTRVSAYVGWIKRVTGIDYD